MIVVGNDQINEYKIVEYKDVVFGVCNATEGVGFRLAAVRKMTENAQKLGANAIINFRIKIYINAENILEATAYGNAVIADPLYSNPTSSVSSKSTKVDLEAYTRRKSESPQGQIKDVNGYKFVVCPNCGTKYKVQEDEKGELHIKGFDDVDDDEPGLQIFCLRCGTKFTVPEKV